MSVAHGYFHIMHCILDLLRTTCVDAQNDKQAETELYTLILHLLHMNMKKKFFTLVKILWTL